MAVTTQRAKVIAADVKRREEHVRGRRDTFYSTAKSTYRPKAMMRSARLDSDMRTQQVRDFDTDRGPVVTQSSLKVVRYETIGGKKFKIVR